MPPSSRSSLTSAPEDSRSPAQDSGYYTSPEASPLPPRWADFRSDFISDYRSNSNFRFYSRSDCRSNFRPDSRSAFRSKVKSISNVSESNSSVSESSNAGALSATSRRPSSDCISLQGTDTSLPPKVLGKEEKDDYPSPLKIWANNFERHEWIAYRLEQRVHAPFHDTYWAGAAGTPGLRMHELIDLLDDMSLSDSRHAPSNNRISTCNQNPCERMLHGPRDATSVLEKEGPDNANLSDLSAQDTQHGVRDYICSSISPSAVPEQLPQSFKVSEKSIEVTSEPLNGISLASPRLSADTSIEPVELSLSSMSETSRVSSEEIGSCCEIEDAEEIISYERQQELLWITLMGATRHRLINRLMSQFHLRYGELYSEQAMEGAEEHAATPVSQSGSGAMSSASQSDPITPRRKGRTREGNGDDEDANENRPRKTRPNPDLSIPTTRRFACPYHKRDTAGFQKSTGFGPCAGPGWNDIAKLKEHLYRRHHRLLQCQRCKLSFDAQAGLDAHAESTTPCQPKARQLQDGFTIEIFLIIQRKKKSFPGQTEEDKWKEIFQLLFPDAEVPSPYYSNEYEHNMESYAAQSTSPLEQYGSSLSNEFRSRAMALVADAMRPLETQLSNHVSTLMEDSRRATSMQNLPLNWQSPGNYSMNGSSPNMSSSMLSSPQSLTFSQDVEPLSQITAAGPGREHPTFSQIDFDFGLFLGPDGMSNELPQRSIGTTSPDSGFASNPSCSCNGICHCQDIFEHRLPTDVQSTPSHGIGSLTNESILNLLQNLSRDVSELKQNLNSKKR